MVLLDLVCLLSESFGEMLVVQPARGIEFFIISSQEGGVFIQNTITREQELVKKLGGNRKKANSYEHPFLTGSFLKVAESGQLVNGVIFHATIIGVLLKSSGLDNPRRRRTIKGGGLEGGRAENNFCDGGAGMESGGRVKAFDASLHGAYGYIKNSTHDAGQKKRGAGWVLSEIKWRVTFNSMKNADYAKRLAIIRNSLSKGALSFLEKRALGQASKSVLRATAKALGLKTGEYDLRFIRGGSSVHGDATLHTENVYVQVSTDVQSGVLVRSCQGRKDYQGGANQWIGWEAFLSRRNSDELAVTIRSMIPETRKLMRPTDTKDDRGLDAKQEKSGGKS
jgi:hypothetical protein